MNAQLLDGIRRLRPLPAALVRLCTVLADPMHTASQVNEIVRSDPKLVAKVAEIGRSAAFRGAARGDLTIEHVVARVGTRTLQALMLTDYALLIRSAGELAAYGATADQVWAKSVRMAVASRLLAERIKGGPPPSLAYTAGLMADVGKLVSDEFLRTAPAPATGAFDQWERDVVGQDHAEVGALLCARWGFPQDLVDAVRHHHTGTESPLAAIVHVADALSNLIGVGVGIEGLSYELAPSAVARVGLTEESLQLMLLETEDGAAAVETLIAGSA